MEWYHIYLFQQVDTFINFFTVVSVASGIASVFALFFWLAATQDGQDEMSVLFKRYCKVIILIFISSSLLYLLIPNRKTIAAMYFVPKIYNSEFVQKDLPDNMKELHGVFRTWIKDLKENKETK